MKKKRVEKKIKLNIRKIQFTILELLEYCLDEKNLWYRNHPTFFV
jgi:hypothetical protein